MTNDMAQVSDIRTTQLQMRQESAPPQMPKGVKRVFRRRGERIYCYYYHRATGRALTAPYGTPEFLTQLARMEAQARHACQNEATLATLIAAYRRSEACQALSAHTRQAYEIAFSWLENVGSAPLAQMALRTPYRLRDRAVRERNQRFGERVHAALRILLAWGKPHGFLIAMQSPDPGRQ